jgi:hypothetical protein
LNGQPQGADARRDGKRASGTVRSAGGAQHTKNVKLAKNHHPTVKPIDLVRYFARLILPPPHPDGSPRRLLVPFSGSGSEIIGALQAGWDEVVGIERDAEYIAIARARIKRGGVFSGLMDKKLRPTRERESPIPGGHPMQRVRARAE